MKKGLMDYCMDREKLVDHQKERAEVAETGLNEFNAQKEGQIKKLDMMKKALEESESHAKALKEVLKDKEWEISSLRKQVHRAKEDGKTEFRNFDGFLDELSCCHANGFHECLHHVKSLFPDLEVSEASFGVMAQTPARSVEPKGTDELFEADPTPDA